MASDAACRFCGFADCACDDDARLGINQSDPRTGEIARLREERDELLLDRHQPDRIAACGHYRIFSMPLLHEDGTESGYCMQCDRDQLQQANARLREALKAVKANAYGEDHQGVWCRFCGMYPTAAHDPSCEILKLEAALSPIQEPEQ